MVQHWDYSEALSKFKISEDGWQRIGLIMQILEVYDNELVYPLHAYSL